MAIAPNLTFRYEFAVQEHEFSQSTGPLSSQDIASGGPAQNVRWRGQGSGGAFGIGEGMAGPTPQFALCAGWLTLIPSEQLHWFSDVEPHQPVWDAASYPDALASYPDALKDAIKVSKREGRVNMVMFERAMEDAAAERRNLAAYSVFVGEALEKVLRVDDKLEYSRNGNGEFHYKVRRISETVFSAGSVGRIDEGGPLAVWQEYDRQFIPNVWIDVHRSYVSVRIKNQIFQLLDGEEAYVHPYYVFLARSNRNVPAIAFECFPRAIQSASRIDLVSKELVVDAARQLMSPKTKIL